MARRKRINIKSLIIPTIFTLVVIVIIIVTIVAVTSRDEEGFNLERIFGVELKTKVQTDSDTEEEDYSDDEPETDLTEDAKNLLQKVSEYDFEKGSSSSLEKEIKALFTDTYYDNSFTSHAYAVKAKVDYYYGIGKYHTAFTALEELKDYFREKEDEIYYYGKKADLYEALGNTEQAEAFRHKYELLKAEGVCGA